MSTIKIFGGSLFQYGNRLNLGLTGSESFINDSAEVEIPPVWELITDDFVFDRYFSTSSGKFLEPAGVGSNVVYHPGTTALITSNGIIGTNNESIGHDFRLEANAFVSASDGNNNESITLTLRSSSLKSGSNDIQEITPSDISIIFPNNSDPVSNQPVAKFFIQTSSNFEIFEDHRFDFVIRAEDSTGRRTVVNDDLGNFNLQPEIDLEYRIEIKNLGTAPFIITQSADVSISSNTSTEDNISEMTFNLGNEGSPDFTLIKDIYIKDRDRTGDYNVGTYDITNIYNVGELPPPFPLFYFDNKFGSYITNTDSLPNIFQISSSHLNESPTDKNSRYFKLRFDDDLLPNKLTADNSPYVFSISASDAEVVQAGISAKSSSCEITLIVDNEDPVWDPGSINIIVTSQQEIGYRLSTEDFASASDPGGGNVELAFDLDPDTLPGDPSGLVGEEIEFSSVNNNTPTASFFLRTSSEFPSYPSNPMPGNALTELVVTASDGVTLAANNQSPGIAYHTVQVRIDAPPAFNAYTLDITKTENEAGLISNSDEIYPNAADPYEGFIGGTCNLDTGSGFTIISDDSRVQDSWFKFTGNNATAGNIATFNIVTSSLFRRVDADVTASLIVTASDARNQEATCSVDIHITNEDALEDIFPSSSNLQFLIAPNIDGETTLGNTVNFSSNQYNRFIPGPAGTSENTLTSIVNDSGPRIRFRGSFADTINTFTSANGTTGLNIEAITTDGKRSQTPEYEAGALSSGPGTIIWWWKTQPNRIYNTISSLSINDVTQQPGGTLGGSGGQTFVNQVASINSVDGSYVQANITVVNGVVTAFPVITTEGFFGVGDTLTFGNLSGNDIIVTLSSLSITNTQQSIFGNDEKFELQTNTSVVDTLRFEMETSDPNTISDYFDAKGDDFHMLSVTFSDTVASSTGTSYLNKTLQSTDTATGGSTMNNVISNAGLIGGRGVSGSYASIHPVTMSMMAYYDAELNQEDITQIFNAFSASHGL